MALKTYSGSCHCGAVRFEADIDLSQGTNRCNCSICAKARSWFALVSPDRFRQIRGAEAQAEYQWTPAGQPGSHLHYRFCKTCGVRTAGRGEHGPGGSPFYFIAVAVLDDANADELAESIRYVDGRHNRFDRAPDDIRLM
ncbi:MAG: glutathione-dependent formaldehyde-activating [Tardiphaga sp.]|jgi:hypothetical protein|nr:glutathione-dependent formaldehyde-activating [Tardiphaga sp.]